MKNLEISYKITNEAVFTENVEDLTVSVYGNLGSFYGDVSVNGTTFTGEHGKHDYEIEYGFVLK